MQDLKKHKGWEVLEQWLQRRAYHSWVSPIGLNEKDWMWAELNAFHSADVATQILKDVDDAIDKAKYLRKKERGEVEGNKFQEIWSDNNGKKKS